jgi:ABC-type glycerol-3-phosphate transport system substrate-binding protein
MNGKKMVLPALVMVFNLVISINVFAGGSRQQAASGVETLDFYNLLQSSGAAGIYEGLFYTEIWKEDLGIVFNVISGSQDVFNAMVASRNMPDIMRVGTAADQITLVQAGLVLNLDDYKDRLPNVYNNVPALVQYYRDYMSNGTGGLYGLGTEFKQSYSTNGSENSSPYLRWDYYKELGMPVLNELEDYLPLLKQMQDAHPVNEAGQRVYGLSLFSDWDAVAGGPDALTLCGGGVQLGYLEIDLVNNTAKSILDADSYYKRTLQFYFNANQLGILDPDSINQGYNDVMSKGIAGRVLFSPWYWGIVYRFRTAEREAAGIGYRMVPFRNMKLYGNEVSAYPVGTPLIYSIPKDTKHLDKALAFINFMYSYDGVWSMYNGKQGVKWDLDENNEPYLTPLGVDIQYNSVVHPTGGVQNTAGHINVGLSYRGIHPVYGRRYDTADWIKKDFAPADTALVADWKRIMNAKDDVDYLDRNNMLVVPPFAPIDPTPDNIMIIQNRVKETVVPLSWQMVYARDQAEFDRLWAEMTEQARGRGLDTVNDWYRDAYARAKVTGAKYVK